MKTLIIVESNKKAQTIQKYLSKDKYIVLASMGHVMDLPINHIGIDCSANFKETYVVNPDKNATRSGMIKTIIREAQKCSKVVLASDPDREGETIAWSLQKLLGLKEPERIRFEDTTKKTINNSINNPSNIDMNLVSAQRARRIIDRIIGYILSPLLQKNINIHAKSAGRVQSVVARIIYDKENDIDNFYAQPTSSYYKTSTYFTGLSKCQLFYKNKLHHFVEEDVVRDFLNNAIDKKYIIDNVDVTVKEKSPLPPFHTSTLQQACSSKLGFNSKMTMNVAQKLYENGLITYMRTDSVNMSTEIMTTVKKYIIDNFDKNFYHKRIFNNKANAQEAHECIRPTDISVTTIELDKECSEMYQLIWKRTVASQMAPAQFEETHISVGGYKPYIFKTTNSKCVFSGFMSIYNLGEDNSDNEEDNSINQENKIGTELKLDKISIIQEFKQPPVRYSETTLNKKIHDLGIGRPSTTASILDKILSRKYVEKKNHDGIEKMSKQFTLSNKKINVIDKKVVVGCEKNKYTITALGKIVMEFLCKHFMDIIDYQYTARMEQLLDDIASGKVDRIVVLTDFYNSFAKAIEACRNFNDYNRLLGKHPTTNVEIFASISKYGPVIQYGDTYKKILKPLTIQHITLQQALELLNEEKKFPIQLGAYKKTPVNVCKGKYGLFLLFGKQKICLNPITEDIIDNFDLDEAILIIDEHNDHSDKPTIKYNDKEYIIMNGPYCPYGPYLLHGAKKYKILPPADPLNLTHSDLAKILQKKIYKKKTLYRKKPSFYNKK
jgi:DNA topoisomerase-1